MKKVLASVALFCTVCLNVQCQKAEIHKTVRLNSGYDMPIIGIGTYLLSTAQAEESVYNALKVGMRLIDIPGSSNAAHIAEDYDIFDFSLTPDEMQRINDLECDYRFASY